MSKLRFATTFSYQVMAALTLMLCLLILGTPRAMAAETWLPDFDPSVHVYTDPALGGTLHYNNNFIADVAEQAQVHNLQVYVVSAEQGSELSGDRGNWAPEMLHNRLWKKWQSASGFNQDRILVILYIRAQGTTSGSIAVRSGTYLHSLNINADLFASASGPVMTAAKQFMNSDPQTGIITVLHNINGTIDNGGAAAQDSGFWLGWSVTTWLIIIFILLLAASSAGGGSRGSSIVSSSCNSGCGGGGGV